MGLSTPLALAKKGPAGPSQLHHPAAPEPMHEGPEAAAQALHRVARHVHAVCRDVNPRPCTRRRPCRPARPPAAAQLARNALCGGERHDHAGPCEDLDRMSGETSSADRDAPRPTARPCPPVDRRADPSHREAGGPLPGLTDDCAAHVKAQLASIHGVRDDRAPRWLNTPACGQDSAVLTTLPCATAGRNTPVMDVMTGSRISLGRQPLLGCPARLRRAVCARRDGI